MLGLFDESGKLRLRCGVAVAENVSAAVLHAESALGADQLIVDVFEVAIHSTDHVTDEEENPDSWIQPQ